MSSSICAKSAVAKDLDFSGTETSPEEETDPVLPRQRSDELSSQNSHALEPRGEPAPVGIRVKREMLPSALA